LSSFHKYIIIIIFSIGLKVNFNKNKIRGMRDRKIEEIIDYSKL